MSALKNVKSRKIRAFKLDKNTKINRFIYSRSTQINVILPGSSSWNLEDYDEGYHHYAIRDDGAIEKLQFHLPSDYIDPVNKYIYGTRHALVNDYLHIFGGDEDEYGVK